MTEIVTTESEPFGTVPQIPNEFATGGPHSTILIDPVQIRAFKETIADQMNKQSSGPRFHDLSDRIANLTIQTSAQGSGILTVSIIDPLWVLLIAPDPNGDTFIQVDAQGFLYPPIDVNFPTGTDMVWRLAQVTASWEADPDPQAGNLQLVFEDRIVSLLREMSPAIKGGVSQGDPNQSLGGFFKKLVDNTNQVLHLRKGERIRLVELISPQDPNYTPPANDLPASAQTPLRSQPLKDPTGPTRAQGEQLKQINDGLQQVAQGVQGSVHQVEQAVLKIFGGNVTPGGLALPPGYVPGLGSFSWEGP